MNKVKKLVTLGMTSLCLLAIPLSAQASAGNLTFTHGNNNSAKSTGGKITSTATEGSMKVDVGIRFDSDSAPTTSYRGTTKRNTKTVQNYVGVAGREGWSFCWYYVDGADVHHSTNWFSFHF